MIFSIRRIVSVLLLTARLGLAADPGSKQEASANASISSAAASPRIRFAAQDFDFGRIPSGAIVKHDFLFTNVGNAKLEIKAVQPGCGCTTAGVWDRFVEPGKTGKIPLQFDSTGFTGHIIKAAVVASNDPQQPSVTLQITGSIWQPIEITPSMAIFNVPSGSNEQEIKSLRIVNNLEQEIFISDLRSTNSELKLVLKTLKPGKEFEAVISVQPPFQMSNQVISITAKTSYEKMPIVSMSAYVMELPPVIVSPAQLFLSASPATFSAPYTVILRGQGPAPFQVLEARINEAAANLQVKVIEPGRVYHLVLTFPVGFAAKPGQSMEITAKTSHPKATLVTIPVILPAAASQSPFAAPALSTNGLPRIIPRVRSSTNSAAVPAAPSKP